MLEMLTIRHSTRWATQVVRYADVPYWKWFTIRIIDV